MARRADDLETPDPRSMLAVADEQARHARTELHPRTELMYLAWGVAWLAGFGAFAAAERTDPMVSRSIAGLTLGVLCAAAATVTILVVRRAAAGVQGTSSRLGILYGGSWLLGFGAMAAIMGGLDHSGLPERALDLLSVVLPCLIVGLLYMGGGAIWQQPTQFALGGWLAVTGAAVAWAGLPEAYLVAALAGGGGLLVGALVEMLQEGTRG